MIFSVDDQATQQRELAAHLDAGLAGGRTGPLSTYMAFVEGTPKDPEDALLWRFVDRTLDTSHVLVARATVHGRALHFAVEVSPAVWPGVAVGVTASVVCPGQLDDVVVFDTAQRRFEGEPQDVSRLSAQVADIAAALSDDTWRHGDKAVQRYTAGFLIEPCARGLRVTASFVPPAMGLGRAMSQLLRAARLIESDLARRAA